MIESNTNIAPFIQLKEDYERRLKTVQKEIPWCEPHSTKEVRLREKAACYREFIEELSRIIINP